MDTGSTEYTIVHKVLDPQPKYNLVLLRRGTQYCVLYEYVTEKPIRILNGLWLNIDELTRMGIEYLGLSWMAFGEMGRFIKDYVGEARWTLATLESL